MKIPIGELIAKSDTEILKLNHAPSTLMQYRWAWHQFEVFCTDEGIIELTEENLASYVRFVAMELSESRFKEWKYKLLRKSALVLWEVQETGTYRWKISRHTSPNDVLNDVFRPVQEQFEAWLSRQRLAQATKDLRSSISRRALASWQEHGITDFHGLTGAEMASVLVSLAESYQPGSMGTVLSAVRVLSRFLEETQDCSGLSRAVPGSASRRVRHVSVLPAEQIEMLANSPDPGTVTGIRDRAMLLLGARTGLRPVDIISLRLQDIDWRQGHLTVVQHKTGAMLRLPLLADVGEAIADYLLQDRPIGVNDEHVFLRTQAPYVALAPSNRLHHMAAGAFARTGLGSLPDMGHGFRVLRSSFATRMLEGDTPLPVISGALGHRGISSANHYLATDEERMRECCLDFGGIEPGTARP